MTVEPPIELAEAESDKHAELEINGCLNPHNPRSFFLYAGAGSGKTRALKNALDEFREQYGDEFRNTGKKIAVITYTNAAANEISSRVGNDSLFPISTIHSFCWTHIGSYHADIQDWLLNALPQEIAELREKQAKGRAGTKAASDRERAIEALSERIDWLKVPRRFTYNPNGDNFGADSLSHSEVLKITAEFIQSKPSLQAVLVNKFPFLLIDESQDTNKTLIEAFFKLAEATKGKFALGLFGDTMQRIYLDGLPDLESKIPVDWAKPQKRINHRSAQRVVQLGNSLRSAVDSHNQLARTDSVVGKARLFIANASVADKIGLENIVRNRMAELCGDELWLSESDVKSLTLEHHMAARRCGFFSMFDALDQDSRLSTGLRKGELSGIRLFSEKVLPLIEFCSKGDDFRMMAHLRKNSPLLKNSLSVSDVNRIDPLEVVRDAVHSLTELIEGNRETTFLEVLKCVSTNRLFEIPPSLRPFAGDVELDSELEEDAEEPLETHSSSLEAWRTFLETKFLQIGPYSQYISDEGPFGTHQGVKGLEFERVLVVMDDSEAKGFLFSYEKLFGAKPLSDQDRKNLADGTETGVDRTRRLLYVTCTRAEKSLALVAYTDDPETLHSAVLGKKWFAPDEVEMLN